MKQQILSHRDIAAVTAPLSLMLHAGISVGDALTLLAEDEQNETLRALFTEMGQNADYGASIARVMEDTGRFPAYVTALLEVGERTGRTEEALNALSAYYEQRERTERRIRSALTYPLILLVLMLVVIVVLLSQVLPVFEEVYASLGGQLTGVAGGLLVLGQWLDSAMPVLCVLLAVMLVMSLTACTGPLSEEIEGEWRGYIVINGETLGLGYIDSDLEDFEASVGLPVIWSFDGDDEVTIEADNSDEADEALETVENELIDYIIDWLCEEEGVDREELEEEIEDEFGMSAREYVLDQMESNYGMSVESFYESLESEGEYEVDDEKMTIEIDGDEMEVELKGDTLTIVDADNDDDLEMLFGDLPIELERVKD